MPLLRSPSLSTDDFVLCAVDRKLSRWLDGHSNDDHAGAVVRDASERFAELLSQLEGRKREMAAAVAERRRLEKAVRLESSAICRLHVDAIVAERNGDDEGARRLRASRDERVVIRQRLESERDKQIEAARALRDRMHRFYAELEDAKRAANT